MWHVEFLTIFPDIFKSFLETSLVGKAIQRNLFSPTLTNIRDFSSPPHNKVDDAPYGGGAGMVMMPAPLIGSIESAKTRHPKARVVLLTPSGSRLTQRKVQTLSQYEALILVCGRYEGVDQRVIDLTIDDEISIGDFVVMGGEVPAMILIEACLRLRDHVIHNSQSTEHESFSPYLGDGGLVEAPQYTRPEEFRGLRVPDVLLSGNHQKIEAWRLEEAQRRTMTLKEKDTSREKPES